MGAILAIAFGIIVFAMLVYSGERIKKEQDEENEQDN